MSKAPSFQFYPGDWLRNSNLRRCSHAARGAWVDVLCLMHDADQYGVLRWPLADIAQAAGVHVDLLAELAIKGVIKGSDSGCEAFIYRARHAGKDGDPVTLIPETTSPCWYSSRFVRDEHVRQTRGKTTQFTPDNQPTREPKKQPTGSPTRTIGERQGDGASSASASASASALTSTIAPAEDQKPGAVAPVEPALDLCGDEPGSGKERAKPADIESVFYHWQQKLGHQQAKLDVGRRKLIAKSLGAGYSVDQLREAIDGCAMTPHNMGLNDRGQRYDGLNIILRNGDQIDRFISNNRNPPRGGEWNRQIAQAASSIQEFADEGGTT